MQQVLLAGKILTALTWLWGAAAIAHLPVPFADLGPLVVLALGLAHTFELAIFVPRLAREHGEVARHIMGIMVFGILHYYSVRPQDLGGDRA